MKTTINYIFIFSLSLFVLFSCKSDDDNPQNTPNADSYTSLSDLVNTLKDEPQTIAITDTSVSNTITGENGTVIEIPAYALIDPTTLNPVTNPVTVKLSEYLTLDKMVRNNIQTSSSGQLLVTGGSFDLNFEDATTGNTVIAPSFSIQASIPVQTDITGLENDMRFYVGNRTTVDGREMVDWQLGGQAEAWFDEGTFNIFGLENGLANCDVLFDMASQSPTQFEVTISGVTDYSSSTVWMFIEDFPSVIMITSLNDTETALETYANSIPTGLNATLLAITVDSDNYLKFGSTAITVAGDDNFNIVTDYGTTEELTTLINTIAN